jgi:metal-dependent amidase/aminoacylase/carboxypeptidase family protein
LTKILWQNYKDQGVEITPWEETEAAMPLASTDFGDVSQKCPSTSSMIDIADLSVSSHSKGFADASITKRGFDAMIVGTKALAMTALELLAEPEKLKEAREFFDSH